MKYSFWKSLIKAIKYPILVFLGVGVSGFIGIYPEWANMTVGGLMVLFYDILKRKSGLRLP